VVLHRREWPDDGRWTFHYLTANGSISEAEISTNFVRSLDQGTDPGIRVVTCRKPSEPTMADDINSKDVVLGRERRKRLSPATATPVHG
jgi:hypothetical protein